MNSTIRVGIIGAGLIGRKRAAALPAGMRLSIVCDLKEEAAKSLATEHGAEWTTDPKDAIARSDAVIIATINKDLAPLTIAAISAGKHVLVEKPGAISVAEMESVVAISQKNPGVKVKIGFNHRYHPAFAKAWEIIKSGRAGELMFLRARYGHGGRIGYDKEWRSDLALSGGGELLDQGSHLIDLSHWFLGEFTDVKGTIGTFYWDMPVEDNGFCILRTPDGKVAHLHASCTEWKNIFSMEIYGKTGKIQIDGLQGSYGAQRLTYYQMKPEMGIPDVETYDFPKEDRSWHKENEEWQDSILGKKQHMGTPEDALGTLRIIFEIYRQDNRRGFIRANEQRKVV